MAHGIEWIYSSRREGFGDLLAEEMARLAQKWGVADEPYHKPLRIYRPMHGTKITAEKVRTNVMLDTLWKMMDALGPCVFGYAPRGAMSLDPMVRRLSAITGWEVSLFELIKASERAAMLAKAFSSHEGFTIKDDTLPGRLFDPEPDGPRAGKKIFEEGDFQKATELLYEIIARDPETGRPHQGKLMELGLEWADELLNQDAKGR